MTGYKYAILDGDAVLLGDHEAWTYINPLGIPLAGQWQEISNADAFTKASLLSHHAFLSMFGSIENELPPAAFA